MKGQNREVLTSNLIVNPVYSPLAICLEEPDPRARQRTSHPTVKTNHRPQILLRGLERRKEKVVGSTDVDLSQVVSRQAQLEEMVEDINQVVDTIKQLLNRMVVPPAQLSIRGRPAAEGLSVEQKVTKATTRGNATSTCRTNSQQVTRSQAESTHSATTARKKHNKARTSRPQNKTASGRPTRLEAPMKSRERELTEDALRLSHNVFDLLGRNIDEDMRTYLEARYNSATSRRRDDHPTFSPINDEINELRDMLEKLVARNTEAKPSTITSAFSTEIQQAPLPAGFRMPTMVIYEGKPDPQDHLDAFNDQMDLLQVTSFTSCRCFVVTLSGITKKQIRQIKLETVMSCRQLSRMFIRQFQGARKYTATLSYLASIKQGPNAMLKAYIKCFNDELATIHNPQENGVMMAAISRIRPETPFWDKLQKDECKLLQEFCICADKIMCLETTHEVVQAGKSTPSKKNNDNNKKWKNGDRRPSPDKKNKNAKAPNLRLL